MPQVLPLRKRPSQSPGNIENIKITLWCNLISKKKACGKSRVPRVLIEKKKMKKKLKSIIEYKVKDIFSQTQGHGKPTHRTRRSMPARTKKKSFFLIWGKVVLARAPSTLRGCRYGLRRTPSFLVDHSNPHVILRPANLKFFIHRRCLARKNVSFSRFFCNAQTFESRRKGRGKIGVKNFLSEKPDFLHLILRNVM